MENTKEAGALSSIGKFIFDPSKAKSLVRNPAQYFKRQLIPMSYSKSLAQKAHALQPKLRSLKKIPEAGRSIAQQKQVGQLLSEQKGLLERARRFRQSGEVGRTAKSIVKPPTGVPAARGQALKDLARYGGHTAMEWANPLFIGGIPAYGAYEALKAPKGGRAETMGRALGEAAGFLAAGPMGLLPIMLAAQAGSATGGAAGKGIGELVSPSSVYDKLKRALTPEQKEMLKGTIPMIARGMHPTRYKSLGAMPQKI
ncbi:MAG: hypothetical protein ACTSPI_00075 [Candidatus Heimdallarchaeaceae archaeon]